jgi:hypothetical protein
VGAQRESVILSAGKQVGCAHSTSPGFRRFSQLIPDVF